MAVSAAFDRSTLSIQINGCWRADLNFKNFTDGSIYGHVVFLLFVICVTVALMNLLNGLAVSDIQNLSSVDDITKVLRTLTDEEITYFNNLLYILENHEEEDFLKKYNSPELQSLKANNLIQIKLFIKAVYSKSSEIVFDNILWNVTDINYTHDNEDWSRTIILDICEAGNIVAFKTLLSYQHLKLPSVMKILRIMICYLDENLFNNWFDFLYTNNVIDVNEKYSQRKTLLEKAIRFKNNTAIKKLCNAGAYIGFKIESPETEDEDEEELFTIDKIDPQVLKEVFDSCITSNEHKLNSKDFKITFNYTNLIRYKDDFDELTTVMRILNSEKLLHFLKHPLITSLMTLKWQLISRIYYLNFILNCFYGLSLAAHIFFVCAQFPSDSLFVILTWVFTLFGIAYLIIREAIRFLPPLEYLSNPSNYLKLLLIFLSIISITILNMDSSHGKIILVLTILFMASEIGAHIGYLPILSISAHMLMLKKVSKTVLKSFTIYSLFVLTFGLCFFVLRAEEIENLFTSIVKTMAMVGELDFKNSDPISVSRSILYLLFGICMTVFLMNLINGLAANDIQGIQEQAELNNLICRAQLLKYHNSKLFTHNNDKYSRDLCSCRFSLSVHPNAEGFPNKVTFPAKCASCSNEDVQEKYDYWCKKHIHENLQELIDSWKGKCTVMGSSIVATATNIITLNEEPENNEKIQIRDIENKVGKIAKDVQNIGKNVEIILKNMQCKNLKKSFRKVHSIV